MRQSAPKNGTRFWMASNIDFSSILDPFWTYFWRVFGYGLGIVDTCTLMMRHLTFFKRFLIIFGLRRYSKIFKIYCKNEVILNIRIFHSRDATIQNSIEKSFKKQLKNQ